MLFQLFYADKLNPLVNIQKCPDTTISPRVEYVCALDKKVASFIHSFAVDFQKIEEIKRDILLKD